MSGTVCCYKGCSNSYSNDKDVVNFFKFPEEPKRRRKWMENCSNPELATMNDRQLRLKRVCSDHFSPLSFMSAETRNQLTEKAVPLSQKEHEAARIAANRASEVISSQKRRGPGRPPKSSLSGTTTGAAKKETKVVEAQQNDKEGEKGDEEDEEDENEVGEEEESGSDDYEYAPPPNIKRQVKQDGDDTVNPTPPRPKGRPPKPKPVDAIKEVKVKAKVGRKKSTTVRKMADLSVIDDVVNQLRACAEQEELLELEMEKSRKRNRSSTDQKIVTKRRRSSGDLLEFGNSDEEFDEEDFDDEEDEDGPERANREFEKFKETLKNAITLPPGWGMGGVIWDPQNRTKVIVASESDVMMNGLIRFKRAVQIFEDSTVRISIDGIDMTLNFGITSVASEEEVEKIINRVAKCKVCCGVSDIEPDDMIYLPYAKKRGCSYYSEACPVIITKDPGPICSPCTALQDAVSNRKVKEVVHSENRKTREVLVNLNHQFGKSMYGLLQEILDDAEALKSDKKQDREAILSKYSNELNVMNGEVIKQEKLPHISVSVDEVSASFQDIVSRLGFASTGPSPSDSSTPKSDVKPIVKRFPNPPAKVHKEEWKKKGTTPVTKIKKKASQPKVHTPSAKAANHLDEMKVFPSMSASNSVNFALSDGQEYELIGEVEGSEVVQVMEMNKDSNKNEAIEIIEVDDETMAKITAQNAGMFFQNAGSTGTIQVAALDPSDPNISQILKAMNSSQEFKVA